MASRRAVASAGEVGPAPLLTIDDLAVQFRSAHGPITAARGMSLSVHRGQAVGLVGESGSGKSVTAMAILGLLPRTARITGGHLWFDGVDLARLPERALRRVRGSRIGMVFQDPLSSLNPVFTVGSQLVEGLRLHLGLDRAAAERRARELLELVEIPRAAQRMRSYPHELSGGTRQRVMIAIALSAQPELVVADEPTTALDVTVQAHVLGILSRLRTELGVALLLISHDLGVVAEVADEIAVAYAGRIVEHGPTDRVLTTPAHPYTEALLRARPRLDSVARDRLPAIAGAPPANSSHVVGCSFQPRCHRAIDICRTIDPPAVRAPHGGDARCVLLEGRHG